MRHGYERDDLGYLIHLGDLTEKSSWWMYWKLSVLLPAAIFAGLYWLGRPWSILVMFLAAFFVLRQLLRINARYESLLKAYAGDREQARIGCRHGIGDGDRIAAHRARRDLQKMVGARGEIERPEINADKQESVAFKSPTHRILALLV